MRMSRGNTATGFDQLGAFLDIAKNADLYAERLQALQDAQAAAEAASKEADQRKQDAAQFDRDISTKLSDLAAKETRIANSAKELEERWASLKFEKASHASDVEAQRLLIAAQVSELDKRAEAIMKREQETVLAFKQADEAKSAASALLSKIRAIISGAADLKAKIADLD